MKYLRHFLMIAALVAFNLLLATGSASADGDAKQCTYEMGSQGVCQEFCWTSCHLCDCGGECIDNCEQT